MSKLTKLVTPFNIGVIRLFLSLIFMFIGIISSYKYSINIPNLTDCFEFF